MWWDPEDEQRIILGSDGGVQRVGTTAAGRPTTSRTCASARPTPSAWTWTIRTTSTAGFQDHDSWKGPSNGPTGRITLENWVTVGPGDGMYNVVDPTDSRWVYNTRELNQMGRMDQKTGVRDEHRAHAAAGPAAAALQLDRADRALAAQPADRLRRRAGALPLAQPRRHWEEISPDLTTNDPAKIGQNVPYCTITSISESPLKRRHRSGSGPTTARCS